MNWAVRLVLDTSAVVAFADHRAIHVGELVTELEDDDAAGFAVPVICLVEAAGLGVADEMLDVLVHRDTCQVIPVRQRDRQALARERRLLGRLDLAAAMLAATDAGAYILTAEPESYGTDVPVIPIEG